MLLPGRHRGASAAMVTPLGLALLSAASRWL
jgi:hypothetical protein